MHYQGEAIDPIDARALAGCDGGFSAVHRVPGTSPELQPAGFTGRQRCGQNHGFADRTLPHVGQFAAHAGA